MLGLASLLLKCTNHNILLSCYYDYYYVYVTTIKYKLFLQLKGACVSLLEPSRYVCNERSSLLMNCHYAKRDINLYSSVFDKLIWRTIGPKSFLFGTAQFSLWASGTVNYDYIFTNSINSVNWLKMYSQWRTH